VLKLPDVIFDSKLVLDDGTQRVEFLYFGPAHTGGDAVAYLPGPGILCTGDACVNGPYEWMGECDSASWIRALESMQQLEVHRVCPGHGSLGGKELLEQQRGFFTELRRQVQQGIDAGRNLDGIIEHIDIPRYKEWTGVAACTREDDIKYVYEELRKPVGPQGPHR
jgi:glyoxylase-like metal-dependent hydrolase (beta-lactamase superfamily II)